MATTVEITINMSENMMLLLDCYQERLGERNTLKI